MGSGANAIKVTTRSKIPANHRETMMPIIPTGEVAKADFVNDDWENDFKIAHDGFAQSIIKRAIAKTKANAKGTESPVIMYSRCQANFMAMLAS